MSKFCMQCGSQIDDNAEICSSCGAAQSNVTTGNEAGGATAVKKSSKAPLIAAVAVIVVVILLIFKALFGGNYKDPIDNMFKAMETGKGKYLYKALPSAAFDSEEFEDMKKSEIIEEFDEMAEYISESLEDAVGKNPKIKVKYLDKEKIDKDDLEEMEDDYKESTDQKIKVSKGYEVEIEVTIKGKDEKESTEMTLEVYKVDGDWCVMDVENMLF